MNNEAYEVGVKLAMVDAGLVKQADAESDFKYTLDNLRRKINKSYDRSIKGGQGVGAVGGGIAGGLLARALGKKLRLSPILGAELIGGGLGVGALGGAAAGGNIGRTLYDKLK